MFAFVFEKNVVGFVMKEKCQESTISTILAGHLVFLEPVLVENLGEIFYTKITHNCHHNSRLLKQK